VVAHRRKRDLVISLIPMPKNLAVSWTDRVAEL